jgi:predicted Zn-dependent protease
VGGLFYQLGRLAGPKIRKAKWVLRSLTGTEAEAIQAEFEVGRDMATEVARELEVDDDAEVRRWLDDIAARLAARVKNRQRRFTIGAVRAPQANAFALPGGFIWITRSLVELCAWDAHEVAFVLGHEMGHVIRKHAMERLMTNSLVNTAMRAVPAAGLMRSQLGGLVLNLLEKGYSQDQELDADDIGVRLARAAGFDPAAAIRLMARLADRSRQSGGLDIYFSSHPPFETRVRQVQKYI